MRLVAFSLRFVCPKEAFIFDFLVFPKLAFVICLFGHTSLFVCRAVSETAIICTGLMSSGSDLGYWVFLVLATCKVSCDRSESFVANVSTLVPARSVFPESASLTLLAIPTILVLVVRRLGWFYMRFIIIASERTYVAHCWGPAWWPVTMLVSRQAHSQRLYH